MVNPTDVKTVTFNNGQKFPILGLGTWQSAADGSVYKAVIASIKSGYRHFDCAYAYVNHEEIGKAFADAIKDGLVKREELFITSKIWLTHFRKERVMINAKKILADLQLEYIDLLLLHWPTSMKQTDDAIIPFDDAGKVIDGNVDYMEAWEGLELVADAGLVKSIGISNFNIPQIQRLLDNSRIKPVTNQVECHPYLSQVELREFCNKHGILLTAYSPLGNPGSAMTSVPAEKKDCLLKDSTVLGLSKKYGKNPGQILIRFQIDSGNLVIPKSVTPERIASNIDVFDFQLEKEELAQLTALDCGYRSCGFDMTKHLINYPFP